MTIPRLTGTPTPVPDLDDPSVLRATADGGHELVGCRCEDCGAEAFPMRTHCYRCFSDRLAELPLGVDGQLYSFTVVRISSSRETPYAIGYVDLPGGLRVLADLGGDVAALRCDQPVRLASDGESWQFLPTEQTEKEAA